MKRIVSICVILILLVMSFCVQASNSMIDSGIDYTETTDSIANLERGFYTTLPITCVPEDTPIKTSSSSLVHLRIGIGAFSKAYNNVEDKEFTNSMLNSLEKTLENIRSKGGTAILRFAYDNFNGKEDMEPSIEMIVKHIYQLQPIFEKNEDIIACIESGFLGPWGEQHTSKMATKENFKKILDTLLEVVPKSITINVRTPKIYADYAGILLQDIQDNNPKKGDKTYRIGIFNDGYLGSQTDLGTYHNRTKEIKWLSNQAKHTFFGGEVVANHSTDGYTYNSASHMIKEMFETHTTYLNQEWNGSVIKKWKETPYEGNDEVYQGKTAWEYINNHLGYRFVIRKLSLSSEVHQANTLTLQGKIENVGAGNVIKPKETTILLKQGETIKSYPVNNLDVRTWNSKEITQINSEIPIPEDLPVGNWEIYLKIANNNTSLEQTQRTIQFANKDIWDTQLGANRLGKIEVKEKIQNSTPETDNTTNTDTDTPAIDNTTNTDTNAPETDNTTNTDTNTPQIDNTMAAGKLPQTGEFPYEIIVILAMILVCSYYLFHQKELR